MTLEQEQEWREIVREESYKDLVELINQESDEALQREFENSINL